MVWCLYIHSIGHRQVHAAKLKDGTRVVIKVQHADVRSLLDIDFANLSTIFRAIAWLEKDFDFTMLMDEWSRAVKKELDFTLEGKLAGEEGSIRKREGQLGRGIACFAHLMYPRYRSDSIKVITSKGPLRRWKSRAWMW